MSLSSQAYAATLRYFGLEKTAARAGLTRVRKAFQAAAGKDPSAAESLADLAGSMMAGRHLPRGSQLRMQGSGREGVVQHVLMPPSSGTVQFAPDPLALRTPGGFSKAIHQARHPVTPEKIPGTYTGGNPTAVLKTYDPTSRLYNAEVQKIRKGMVGNTPDTHAEIFDFQLAPGRVNGLNTEQVLSQYIHSGGKGVKAQDPDVREAMRRARHKGEDAAMEGHTLLDVTPNNMMRDVEGDLSVIDAIPVPNEAVIQSSSPPNEVDKHLNMRHPVSKAFNFARLDAPPSLRAKHFEGAVTENEQAAAKQRYIADLIRQAYENKP